MKIIQNILGFVRSGNINSSKRLSMIASYLIAYFVVIFDVVNTKVLDLNTLILILSLCGISSGNYALTVGKEKDGNKSNQED